MLVAAVDLAQISGRVFDDFSGNGFDAGEEVAMVQLDLYRDDGDGQFEPGSGDPEVRMTMTDANGNYSFERLTAGNYFVLQPSQTASGRTLQREVSPLITISDDDIKGLITTTIDSFDQTSQFVRDDTNDSAAVTSVLAAPEAIGGERDLFANKTSTNGAVQLSVDDPLLPNQLTFDSILTGAGNRRITWDGVDGDATVVNDSGLSGANLNVNAEGIQLQIRADLAGGTALVRVFSDDGNAGTANRFSTASIAIPVTAGTFLSAEFIPFTAFAAAGSAGGADFSNVGAIELEISGAADVNGAAEVVGAVGQTTLTQNFDNFETADLSLTKSVNDNTPSVGQSVAFTITVNNAGPDGATGVVVSDVLPTGITFTSATGGTYDSTTGRWTVGNVPNGGSATLTINGTVASTGAKTNTAQVLLADQTDPDSTPGNDIEAEDDQASVTLTPETIDLSLTKTVNNANPNVGDMITFTVTLRNDGPSTATNVSVRDSLPAGLTLVSSNSPGATYNTTTGAWTIPSLAITETRTLTLSAMVNASGSRTNTAEVIGADQTDVDSTPNNNVSSEDDQASVSFSTPVADLSLTKSVDQSLPNVGDEVTFTVQLNNAGPDPASGVVVTDLQPTGLTAISSTVNAGNYVAGTGLWTIGDVAVGATPTLTIRSRVDSAAATTNTARVTAANEFDPDSSPGNNVEAEDDQASVTVDPPSIDLSLTKTIDKSRPNVGDEVAYTVTLSNSGPNGATGVIVNDTLPVGMTFLSATENTGSYDSVSGNWTVPSLASGASTTLTIRGRVDSASSLTNTAQVTAADQFDTDSTPGNNIAAEDDQASVAFTLASADLSLTKTVNNGSPNVGQNVTFTVTVNNTGPDAATGVSVRDQLPAGTTFVSANATVGSYDSVTGLWQIPSIPTSGSATLTIVAMANTNDIAINTAEIIEADQLDPDSTPGNGVVGEDDIATAQIQAQQIDLSLTKTISDAAPNVGSEVSFLLTVRNDGPSAASGVSVTDTLPVGVTLIRGTASGGSFNTTNRVWTIPSLGVGQQQTLEILTRVDQVLTGAINTAEVTTADQPDVDSTPANNVTTEDDQASVTFSTPVADLSLTKTVSNALPNIGEAVTFEVQLTNSGLDGATGVQVTDVLPAGVRFVSTSLSAGTYDPATGIWNVGAIANGATAMLSINAVVETQGEKTNTARVTSADQADPDSTAGNNVDSEDDQASVALTPQVIDLSLTKTVSDDNPAIGDTITFTVTASNAGPSNATGVIVRDLLPGGMSFVDSTTASGDYLPISGNWTLGSLAAGASATLELTATVVEFAPVTNTAEVIAADQVDSDSEPGNANSSEDDLASVLVSPASADLSLTKTVSDAAPNIGQDVTYTITVTNDGPNTAEQIRVRDRFPAGLTLVSSTTSPGSYDPTTGNWDIVSLANGASATLQLVGTVVAQTDQINAAEIIASSQFDPDSTPGNGVDGEDDQADVSLTPQLVDLALTKMIDDMRPNSGDSIAYTLTLSNSGPSEATGVEVTDPLPDGVIFESFNASQGTFNSASGVWTVGSVAMGGSPTLVINATVGNPSGETNTAEVTAVDQVDVDSTPGNNVASEDDQSSVAFTTQVADLSLTKTVDNSSPNQGENVFFTVTLRNAGPDTATSVVVQDLLPAGFTLVSSSPSSGAFDQVNGLWSLPTVPVSTSAATLQIEAMIVAPTGLTNTAEIQSARQFDPDSTPGNAVAGEDDIASVVVTPLVVDIAVSAVVDNPEPLEGDVIRLMFTTENQGTTGATGVVTRALIPAGLTVLTAVPSRGTYDVATGIWNVGAIASATSTALIVTARVDTRGVKEIPVEVINTDQFDVDSSPNNNVENEDDQTNLLIRAPRLLTKRLFLSR